MSNDGKLRKGSEPEAPHEPGILEDHGPFGVPALDRLAAAVGGRTAVIGLGAAALLATAAMMLGVLPSPFGDTAVQRQQQTSSTSGQSLFTKVPKAEVEKAIALLMLPDPDKAKVRGGLQSGTLGIALITVSDNDTEDGDWVSITAAGFRQDVRLFHKPYTVAVPYVPGLPVAVTGLKDGGGGDITVAVSVGAAKLSLKPLKERETVQLPPP